MPERNSCACAARSVSCRRDRTPAPTPRAHGPIPKITPSGTQLGESSLRYPVRVSPRLHRPSPPRGARMSPSESLHRRIQNGECLVGIIGLGYVGLPLAQTLHAGGLRILGFDTDPRKIELLAQGRNYIKHLGDD